MRESLREDRSMEIAEMASVLALIGIGVVIVIAILLGPSLFSSFENWRIKRAIER
jgi:hypothetical protein